MGQFKDPMNTLFTPKGQLKDRSWGSLKIPCPPFNERRPSGWWHGKTQITHNDRRIVDNDCSYS